MAFLQDLAFLIGKPQTYEVSKMTPKVVVFHGSRSSHLFYTL